MLVSPAAARKPGCLAVVASHTAEAALAAIGLRAEQIRDAVTLQAGRHVHGKVVVTL